ncbi:GUN4 domain-containing protein [Microcoleus sp. FACHB-SPT15]|uniref:GUN4 domain-containing protein n=1 Tax=Microcoleus sp. FACHB-SPT15 TaxID=2692830 RepID=UPI00177EBCBD|nr:GUN4 domain-containing protein [Microcoleus sp. FACHB-SPT15]MBD1808862.1 GUN4 domain-containing protein [Microcoleus sp. FACHB-SPT15]
MPPRFHLPRYLLPPRQKLKYYFGLSLAVAGALVALWGFLVLVVKPGNGFQPDKFLALSRLIAGAFAMGIGGNLLLSRQYNSGISSFDDDTAYDNPTINTGGGNYNEFISGHYIQGDYINMNSNLPEATAQLQELITQLEVQGCDLEEALQRVTNDLASQATSNPTVRVKLRRWRKSVGDTAPHTSLFEAARTVVQAASVFNIQSGALSSTGSANYQRLERLLADGKWRDADEETARIIVQGFRQAEQEGLVYSSLDDYIEWIPGEDLLRIDNLWVNYSNRRFGFSVQKKIWREVNKDYEAFGDRVGWRVESEWILYSDIAYQQQAPSGHLPITVMMLECLSYSDNSCGCAESVLDAFVSRQYKVY